jgi:hypothetical protein
VLQVGKLLKFLSTASPATDEDDRTAAKIDLLKNTPALTKYFQLLGGSEVRWYLYYVYDVMTHALDIIN